MTQPPEESIPGQLELLKSARRKYTLALARVRYGPPDLALLSLHGSLEDALRSHGMRVGLKAALAPLPQLLEALVTAPQVPLSVVEAEGIQRMHRLRAHVAHGEQIAVTEITIAGYHQLVARLLPRYGVMVVGPEAIVDEGVLGQEPGEAATATTTRMRRDEPEPEHGRERRATGRQRRESGPRRERTVYPDDQPARYLTRGSMPSAATRDLPLAQEMLRKQRRGRRREDGELERVEYIAEFWERSQRWLLPALVVVSLLLIGAVVSMGLQEMRPLPVQPTAEVEMSAPAPAIEVPVPPVSAPEPVEAPAPMDAPEAAPNPEPDAAAARFVVGQTVYVQTSSPGLNLRDRPSAGPESAVQAGLTPGTAVEIIGGPNEAEGFDWWYVRAGGVEGWCVGALLEAR